MAVEDQLLGWYICGFRGGVGWDRIGQRLTITDRTVFKLAFKTHRIGAPPPASTITFTIRKTIGDAILASKLWGAAEDVPAVETWLEVTWDIPVYVNEGVRLLMEWGGPLGNAGRLAFFATTPSVKAGENVTRYTAGAYSGEAVAWDATYSYTYDLPLGMKGLGLGAMAKMVGV